MVIVYNDVIATFYDPIFEDKNLHNLTQGGHFPLYVNSGVPPKRVDILKPKSA